MLSTKTKIRIAAGLSKTIRAARRLVGAAGDTVEVTRNGLCWSIDLREGIDLAIYLGVFERSTVAACRRYVALGATVLDIGANIGAHTLPLASLVGPDGHVYAFEPTDFAFRKLAVNLALNPRLAARVTAEQAFLGESSEGLPAAEIYSSWPLDASGPVHEKHLGRAESTIGARTFRLDDYLEARRIQRVDLVKMDVDGFECHVLGGASRLLATSKPVIVMELAPYVLTERGRSIEELIALLAALGYRFFRLEDESPLTGTAGELAGLVPEGASTNIVARVLRTNS